MWKFKKGIVVRTKDTRLWGHVVGFVSLNDGGSHVVVELENGSRSSYIPADLEGEWDQ